MNKPEGSWPLDISRTLDMRCLYWYAALNCVLWSMYQCDYSRDSLVIGAGLAPSRTYIETEMSSFWWNFHLWLHWKLSNWQLPVQPVIKISSKWRHFRFSVCNHHGAANRSMCVSGMSRHRSYKSSIVSSCIGRNHIIINSRTSRYQIWWYWSDTSTAPWYKDLVPKELNTQHWRPDLMITLIVCESRYVFVLFQTNTLAVIVSHALT